VPNYAKLITCILIFTATQAYAEDSPDLYEPDCLPLHRAGKYGPYDYNKTSSSDRNLVERIHFTEHYQAYRLGKAKFQKKSDHIIETPAAGFSYTLWAFPNHSYSLAAMEDIAFKNKNDTPPGAQLRIHCYFQRAVRFIPDDPLVRAIYGYYYARRGKKPEAVAQLHIAESLNDDDYSVAVYAAFAYFEIQEYEMALAAAKRAYKLGYQLPGLRKKFERAGIWKE
jgi:tetratricopeptide (TPR) repeat protein